MPTYRTYYTRAGQALGAKLLERGNNGGTPFTRAMTGAGEYTLDEAVRDRTALKDVKQIFGFSADPAIVDEHNVILRFMVTNTPPQEVLFPYDITEIGIFAEDPDEGEILYALILPDDTTDMRLDQMVPYDGGQATHIQMAFTIAVVDAEVAYIVAGSDAFALADDFNEHVRDQGGRRFATAEIPRDAWYMNSDDIAQVDIAVEWATPDFCSEVYIFPESDLIGCACGIDQMPYTGEKVVTLTAQTIPIDTIKVFIRGQRMGGVVSMPVSLQQLLMPATADRLGTVRVGEGMHVTEDGVLSVNSSGAIAAATLTESEAQSLIDSAMRGTEGDGEELI